MASSTIMNRRDLQFLLYEWLDVTALAERERYADPSRETFDAVLDLSEQLAADHFARTDRGDGPFSHTNQGNVHPRRPE